MSNKSIIYVNFTPYENTGKILDYLLQNFTKVALFSFSFHRLKSKNAANKLLVYHNKKLIETKKLFDFDYPKSFIFFLLPLRSLVIFTQVITYSLYLKIKYSKFNYYFTVNAFTAWIGIILKKIRVAEKTIFWVYDYYPPFHESKIISLMRSIYWQFDRLATKSDVLAFLNRRIVKLRTEIGELNNEVKYKIIPVGTINQYKKNNIRFSNKRKLNIAFLGVIKKSSGLQLYFENTSKIKNSCPNIQLHVIGSGPDLSYFRKIAISNKSRVKFYGFVSDSKIGKILQKCDIGLASYPPGRDNVSYYGDPSKIKTYLSYGLPVITTDAFEFSTELKKHNAGEIIDYSSDSLIKAIIKVKANLKEYSKNASRLAKKYYFKKLYHDFFLP